MRIAILGDTHLGRKLKGYDLTTAIRDELYGFHAACRENHISTAVHLGDLFDTPRPALEHEKIAIQWCNEFERSGIQLYLLTGNHDVLAAGSVASALDLIKAFPYKHVRVIDRPCVIDAMLFLPFPSSSLYESQSAWLDAIYVVLGDVSRAEVAFTHLNISGVEIGEQEWVYRGGDYLLPEVMWSVVDVLFAGHIHKPQTRLVGEDGIIYVVGAAQRFSFAERNNAIAFHIYDNVSVTTLDRKGLPLVQLEVDATCWAGSIGDVQGSIVKVKPFAVDGATVDMAAIEEHLYQKGAVHVCFDVVTRETAEQEQRVQPVNREPLKAAAEFIKTTRRTSSMEEKKALYSRFKTIHRKVSK